MTILMPVIAFYHKMLLFVRLSSFFLFCQNQENLCAALKGGKKREKEKKKKEITLA